MGKLEALNVTVLSFVIRSCQKCLLERAGAIHIELIDNQPRNAKKYYVAGPQDYLRANMISCIDQNSCFDPEMEDSELQLFPEGISGKSSTAASRNNHIEKYMHETNLPFDVDQHDQTSIETSKEEPKQLCVFRHDATFSFLCEACMKANSDFGSMAKYFSYQSRTRVVFVIYSSDLEDFVKLCIKTKICNGTTALLSDDLCNLFNYQISAKAKQSRKMPQLTGTILNDIRLFTTINQVAARKKEIKTILQPLTFHS